MHLMRLDYSPGAPSGPSASLKAVHVTPELATAAQRVSCLHHMTTLTSALNKIGQCELPDNKTANEIATAMAEAVRLYNERYHRSSRDVCIVRNAKSGTAAGSGLIEAALLVNHALASHRRTVEELMRDVQVDEQSRVVRLVRPLDPARTVEVALVYYESPGYDFDDEAAWTVRRALEESLAVTSPSIPLQLLGQPELQLLWRGDERLRSALRFDEHSPEDLSKCLAVLQDTSSGPLVPSGMPCAAVDVELSSKEGRVVSKVVEDTECAVGIFSCLVMNGMEVAFDRTAGHVLRTFGDDLSEPLIDTALLTPRDITEDGSDSVVE